MPRITLERRQRVFLPGLFCVVAAVGCVEAEQLPPIPMVQGDGGAADPAPVARHYESSECEPGELQNCEAELDEGLGCVVGLQTCSEDGEWGPCIGGLSGIGPFGGDDGDSAIDGSAIGIDGRRVDADVDAIDGAPVGGEAEIEATSLSPAQGCVGNPCDPSCKVFGEIPPGGLSTPTTVSSSGAISSLPGGFQDHGQHDAMHPPSYAGCDGPEDCSFDTYCDTTLCNPQKGTCGTCVAWGAGQYANTTKPNFTMPLSCGGKVIVCNRGSVTAPAGAKIAVVNGNSSQLQDNLGKCSGTAGSVSGTCTTPSTIAPGQCIEAPGCAAYLSGTKALVVNSSPAASPYLAETTCGDNWSVYSVTVGSCTPGYAATEYKQTYVASCPYGQQPVWGKLAWNGTTQTNSSGASSIRFKAHTRKPPTAFDASCSDCVTVGNTAAADPAVCSMAGPSPCPKSFAAALGTSKVHESELELVITLSPTPDLKLPATLTGWEVSYTCIDAQ
jgi:hypothetical protein